MNELRDRIAALLELLRPVTPTEAVADRIYTEGGLRQLAHMLEKASRG